jgi:hypothetical protein
LFNYCSACTFLLSFYAISLNDWLCCIEPRYLLFDCSHIHWTTHVYGYLWNYYNKYEYKLQNKNVSKSVCSHQQKVPSTNINTSYHMNECNVTTSPFHIITQQYRHSESVPMIYLCPPLQICINDSVEWWYSLRELCCR